MFCLLNKWRWPSVFGRRVSSQIHKFWVSWYATGRQSGTVSFCLEVQMLTLPSHGQFPAAVDVATSCGQRPSLDFKRLQTKLDKWPITSHWNVLFLLMTFLLNKPGPTRFPKQHGFPRHSSLPMGTEITLGITKALAMARSMAPLTIGSKVVLPTSWAKCLYSSVGCCHHSTRVSDRSTSWRKKRVWGPDHSQFGRIQEAHDQTSNPWVFLFRRFCMARLVIPRSKHRCLPQQWLEADGDFAAHLQSMDAHLADHNISQLSSQSNSWQPHLHRHDCDFNLWLWVQLHAQSDLRPRWNGAPQPLPLGDHLCQRAPDWHLSQALCPSARVLLQSWWDQRQAFWCPTWTCWSTCLSKALAPPLASFESRCLPDPGELWGAVFDWETRVQMVWWCPPWVSARTLQSLAKVAQKTHWTNPEATRKKMKKGSPSSCIPCTPTACTSKFPMIRRILCTWFDRAPWAKTWNQTRPAF